jgi:tetratricopeptide (TPR) repeat protein
MAAAENNDLSAANPESLKMLLDQLTSVIKLSSPYSDVELNAFYNVGVRIYQQGKWQDASRLFGMINILAPFNSLYLTAQGKCLKCLAAYDDAYEVFHLAWTIDKRLPEPALHAAECLMLAGRKDEASDLIREVLETPAMKTKNQDLREKSEAWMTFLTCGEHSE